MLCSWWVAKRKEKSFTKLVGQLQGAEPPVQSFLQCFKYLQGHGCKQTVAKYITSLFYLITLGGIETWQDS